MYRGSKTHFENENCQKESTYPPINLIPVFRRIERNAAVFLKIDFDDMKCNFKQKKLLYSISLLKKYHKIEETSKTHH